MPPGPRPPATPLTAGEVLAVSAILAVVVGDLLFLGAELATTSVDLGFTRNNVVYLVVRPALSALALLVAGAAVLGRRGGLVAVGVIVGLQVLLVVGMAGVQLALGARPEFAPETGALLGATLLVAGGVAAGFRGLRTPVLRWLAVLLCLAGLVVWELGSVLVGVLVRHVRYTDPILTVLLRVSASVLLATAAVVLTATPRRTARLVAVVPVAVLIVLALTQRPWTWEPAEFVVAGVGRMVCLAVAGALAVGAGLLTTSTPAPAQQHVR